MGSVRQKRIIVPQRSVSGGMAFKFETDPYNVKLHGLLSPEQYTEAIENLNTKLRPSRAGAIDGALLVTGPLLVPLALWGVRHRSQTKKRKRLLKEGMHAFNMQYQELVMRWNRRPAGSVLIIEERHYTNDDMEEEAYSIRGRGQGVQVVQATVIPDSGTAASQQRPRQSQTRQVSQRQQQQQPVPRQSQQMARSSAPRSAVPQQVPTLPISEDGLV